jgi:hypothetical protein
MSSLPPSGPPSAPPRTPHAGRLLGLLRGVAQKRLSGLIGELFAGVDDALFDMAERAASNTQQGTWFDGMREIRRKRLRAEALWQEAINRQLQEFEGGKLAPTADELGDTRKGPADVLALVDEAELEESLAVDAMVDKADTRLNRPLYALNQRFGVLAAGRKVDNANNPIGPRLLSRAFATAIAEFEVALPVKLIVLKLFERHVLAGLESLYDECNTILVQAGVLPELRYSVPARRRDPAAPAIEQAAEAAVAEAIAEVEGGSERGDQEILQVVGELRSLLAARRGGGVGGAVGATSGPPSGAAGGLGARELLNALTLMQEEMQAQGYGAPSAQPAAAVKQELLRQVRRLGGPAPAPGHLGADEDTIDLVGMLFEYAVQDRNLPPPIAAMLGRLQIPYLKVALLDREFIAHKSHPARRLLDELALACMGWSEESDRDHRLYNKVQEVVATLLRDFDDDTGIFERLSADFGDFIEKNRKRAELVERRTTETARGKERLEVAQRTAARALLSRLEGRQIPPMVRDLLSRKWSNYLVLTYLRHGEDSAEWRAATRFIDDFAWSVEPKKDEADRLRLREMTPEIERLLRQGLASTGLHEGHLQELWDEVARIYRQQQAPTAASRAPEPAAAPEQITVSFAAGRGGEEVVFGPRDAVDDDDVDMAAVEALGTWLKIARALKAGTWFEFVKDDGSRERAKLLWISTIKALYLFVNRNGLKIAEKTASELAEELKEQKAVILEQVALVDRALDAILHKLKDGGAEGEAAGKPTGGVASPIPSPAAAPAAAASTNPAAAAALRAQAALAGITPRPPGGGGAPAATPGAPPTPAAKGGEPKVPSPAVVKPTAPGTPPGVRGPSTPTRH